MKWEGEEITKYMYLLREMVQEREICNYCVNKFVFVSFKFKFTNFLLIKN